MANAAKGSRNAQGGSLPHHAKILRASGLPDVPNAVAPTNQSNAFVKPSEDVKVRLPEEGIQNNRPGKFQRSQCSGPPAREMKTIPKARELVLHESGQTAPPPADIAAKLEAATTLFAFDIETHALIPENLNVWVPGKHGFPARVGPLTINSLRVVQIGWAAGAIDCHTPETFLRYVKPEGFAIAADATLKHNIAQEFVDAAGEPLALVLTEMMNAVREWRARGGRLVAHQIEFDAGVIAAELERCGLNDLKTFWEQAVREGICTMDPAIAVWVREGMTDPRDDKPISWNTPLGLTLATQLLVPQSEELRRQHHSADKDAAMAWLFCRELVSRCKGS